MALLTGHTSDTTAINAKLENIKNTFNKTFWQGKYYMSWQVSTPDDRANAMAVNAGLAEPSKWDAIHKNVLTKYTNSSCFFDRWVFEALCKMGKQEDALLRMYNRYKTMIPASFTTLWEHYDRWWASRINAFDEASSLNHGWNPPVLLLSQDIAGVAPVEAGWSIYHVFPKEAFLTSINVTVPTIKGDVKVDIKKTNTKYSIKLNSPLNTNAIIGIPKSSFSTISSIDVNGKIIWTGRYTGGMEGVTWAGEDTDYIKFNVIPGTWNFTGTGILPLSSPKPEATVSEDEIRLNKKSWTATASTRDSSFLFSGDSILINIAPANAIDGDHWTGWRDMTTKQHPNQWFMIDMKQQQRFDKIVLDNTWALWDSPDKYAVSVSNNGIEWGKPVAEGSGESGITTINFPAQKERFIKITQTGNNTTYHWSVYEIDVYRKK